MVIIHLLTGMILHGTWKWHPGIGDSFWKPSFLGSMFNLGRHDHKHHIFIHLHPFRCRWTSSLWVVLHQFWSHVESYNIWRSETPGGFDTRGEVLRCWGNPGATAGVTSNDPKICGFYYTWSQVDVVVGSPFPLKKSMCLWCFFFVE